jgi:hypothetical protein
LRLPIAICALVLAALAAGAAAGAPVKLPKTLKTPTGNFITLYAVETSGGTTSADLKVCTSSHTPTGTMVIPSFYSLRLSNGSRVPPGAAVKSPALKMTPLGPLKCVRGWLSFPVPKGASPAALVYTYGAPIVWQLK